MNEKNQMKYYEPEAVMSMNLKHTLLYNFQFEDAFAKLITSMGGNVAGGETMITDFNSGLTVPTDHDLTKKHVTFYDDNDKDLPYREVGSIIFYYPDGETITLDLEDCTNYLIGIQIVGCEV